MSHRLFQICRAHAQSGLVASGERGRRQVFLGRGRAHRPQHLVARRCEELAEVLQGLPLVRHQRQGSAEPLEFVAEGGPLVRRRVGQRGPGRGCLNLVEPRREEPRGEHDAGRNREARLDHPDQRIAFAADLREGRLPGAGKRNDQGLIHSFCYGLTD